MPVVKVTRTGVRSAAREVPTDNTSSIMPMTFDRVGQECPENEEPVKVSSVAEAFQKFHPQLDFKTKVGDDGAEFVAKLDFKSLSDFDPRKIRARDADPNQRNDLADLQSRIDLLNRMRERFTMLSVKKAWENTDQRSDIIEAVAQFEEQLRRIAATGGKES